MPAAAPAVQSPQAPQQRRRAGVIIIVVITGAVVLIGAQALMSADLLQGRSRGGAAAHRPRPASRPRDAPAARPASRAPAPAAAAAAGPAAATPAPAPAGGAGALVSGRARRSGRPSIFVSMAAFRDSEAAQTLRDLFAKAEFPERVFVGLVCQRDTKHPDEDCLPRSDWAACATAPFCASDQVRVRDFESDKAKGPTFARYIASLLYKGEDYFMMMDSHNKFADKWDSVIVRYHRKCPSRKCALSVYPMGTDSVGTPWVAHLCKSAQWHQGGYPGPFLGQTYTASPENRPQPFVGAGLVFGPGALVEEVPFDPMLPFLFHGEEILLTVRLWTHGYDFYSPGDNILWHHYYRRGKPRMEAVPGYWQLQQKAVRRVQHLLQIRPASGDTDPEVVREARRYGMGSVRNVSDYWKFAGLDISSRNHDDCNAFWCPNYRGQPPYNELWRRRLPPGDPSSTRPRDSELYRP